MAQEPVLMVMAGLLVFAISIGLIVLFLRSREKASVDYDRRRLSFAAFVLAGLGLLFVLAISMYYFASSDPADRVTAGAKIFETSERVIPPIITLVLGYYFGRSEAGRPRTQASDQQQKEAQG